MRYEQYRDRPLSSGYPDLEKLGVEWFEGSTDVRTDETVQCLERLIDLSTGLKTIAVIGCGPRPESIKILRARGYEIVGIEPVGGFVEAARQHLGDADSVRQGTAEHLPLPSESQRVVLLEWVLEHVDSPLKALEEAYRVTAPGGVLYVSTTNRHRFNLSGYNGEFRTPFFNWLPRIVQECYVFEHLHFDPKLANFTQRPAVHWFSFSDLCALGRTAGFGQFYSRFDLIDFSARNIGTSRFRRLFVRAFRSHRLLRAVGLVQFGESIFMLKRPA